MAKKQVAKAKPPKDEPKAKGPKLPKDAKTGAKAGTKSAAKEAAKSAVREVAVATDAALPPAKRRKASKVAAAEPALASVKRKAKSAARLPDVAAPAAAASAKVRKAVTSAGATALGLVPAVPKLPGPSLPDIDVKGTARDLGNRILAVLDTPAGRVVAAELLLYVAGALTKAAAQSETGREVKDGVMNAGAKIGAAVAGAGAKLVESGTEAAQSGAEAASEAAYSARDLVREVAQVAVGAVGDIVADTAAKVSKRRGRKAEADTPPASPPGVVPA